MRPRAFDSDRAVRLLGCYHPIRCRSNRGAIRSFDHSRSVGIYRRARAVAEISLADAISGIDRDAAVRIFDRQIAFGGHAYPGAVGIADGPRSVRPTGCAGTVAIAGRSTAIG